MSFYSKVTYANTMPIIRKNLEFGYCYDCKKYKRPAKNMPKCTNKNHLNYRYEWEWVRYLQSVGSYDRYVKKKSNKKYNEYELELELDD